VYSPIVVERNLYDLKKKGYDFKRRSIEQSLGITEKLKGQLDEKGNPKRAWAADEQAFMKSEGIICRYDFRYFAERYAFAEIDASEGGGLAPAKFWPSQERALTLIAAREEENYAEVRKHGFTEGIRGVWHKTRQQGATALMRLVNGHRMSLYKNTRAIAASLDTTKVFELYKRDKIFVDNLPFFLKPEIYPDVTAERLGFDKLGSNLTYQQANQQAGVGTGQQFDLAHMTEVALWPNASRLQFDFLPAVPQAVTTFVALESTANGRGDWWHEFTESVRHKDKGFERWIYVFTPWYINLGKNRSIAPDNWTPGKVVLEHADLVERTSIEFAGETVRLNRNQLYWWESEYDLNRKMGTLHIFFSNYPATPEQSFQHNSQSALPVDCIDWMRSTAQLGMPYTADIAYKR
jgi:hypothetical protein